MSQGGHAQPGPGRDQPASGAGAWEHLGRLVRERRADLGLTQREVHSFGGPSPATLYQLESGQRGSYRPQILRRLERALGWGAGSVRRVLAGGLPVLDDDPAPSVSAPAAERASRPRPDNPSGTGGLEWMEGFRRLPIDPRDKLLLLSSLIAETIADLGTDASGRGDGRAGEGWAGTGRAGAGRGGNGRRVMPNLSPVPADAGEDGWTA